MTPPLSLEPRPPGCSPQYPYRGSRVHRLSPGGGEPQVVAAWECAEPGPPLELLPRLSAADVGLLACFLRSADDVAGTLRVIGLDLFARRLRYGQS